MPNMQRIVDERDSYLESIIELEQDKDFLTYKLQNSTQTQAGNGPNETTNLSTNNGTRLPIQVEAKSDNDLKNLTINELIINLVNNSSTICNMTNDSNQIDPATGLIDLNDTNMKLLKLIDSINKNELLEKTAALNDADSENYYSDMISDIDKTKTLMIGENILNDLKNKKKLASNWNQKIAIELVECKIRLKQLINEMYVNGLFL